MSTNKQPVICWKLWSINNWEAGSWPRGTLLSCWFVLMHFLDATPRCVPNAVGSSRIMALEESADLLVQKVINTWTSTKLKGAPKERGLTQRAASPNLTLLPVWKSVILPEYAVVLQSQWTTVSSRSLCERTEVRICCCFFTASLNRRFNQCSAVI